MMENDVKIQCRWRVLFILLLCAISITGTASAFELDGFNYTINEDGKTCTVTGTLLKYGDLKIPSTITVEEVEYSVTVVGEYAFYNSEFSGVLTLPNSLDRIEKYAFCSSKIKGALTIPEGATYIGDYAFAYCTGIAGALRIPNSVSYIGEAAFANCEGLSGALTLPEELTKIYDYTFRSCSKLYGRLELPNNVISIGAGAFSGCEGFSGDLKIPNSVTIIGNSAFMDCKHFTGSLIIPSSVIELGAHAFSGCSGFNGGLSISDSLSLIPEYAFSGCSALTGSLYIPNNIKSIGTGAFMGCSGFMGTLTIPNGVRNIGDFAFMTCTGLTSSLIIGENVENIGSQAFYWCDFSEIVSLNPIPPGRSGSFDFIGPNLFTRPLKILKGCEDVYRNAPTWKNFSNVSAELITQAKSINLNPAKLTVTEGDKTIIQTVIQPSLAGLNTIEWRSSNERVATVDESGEITAIQRGTATITATTTDGSNLSAKCVVTVEPMSVIVDGIVYQVILNDDGDTRNRVEVLDGRKSSNVNTKIPEVVKIKGESYIVTKIGGYAFKDCVRLNSITFPNTVEVIGHFAFLNCTGLTELGLPQSLKTIETQAFGDCTGIRTVEIPSSVERIEEYAFAGVSLPEITIPRSVSYIGWGAFMGVQDRFIVDPKNECFTTINDVLYNIDQTKLIEAPINITEIDIPNTVETIGFNAFTNCTKLAEITFPTSVRYIGMSSFSNTGLRRVYIPKSIVNIDPLAFSCCGNLAEFIIEDGSEKLMIGNIFYESENKPSYIYIGRSVEQTNYGSVFSGNSMLQDLSIGGEVSEICEDGFTGCADISSVKVYNVEPPKIKDDCFENIVYKSATLMVPSGAIDAYARAFGWRNFRDIRALPDIKMESIVVRNSSIELRPGATEKVEVVTTPYNATNKGLKWISADESVAVVDNNGNVTGVSPGKTIITVASTDGSLLQESCCVTVLTVSASSIELSDEIAELVEGEILKLTATISPFEVIDKTVLWESSDESIASVGNDGLVTALKQGFVNIVAKTSNGLTASCAITVRAKEGSEDIPVEQPGDEDLPDNQEKPEQPVNPDNPTEPTEPGDDIVAPDAPKDDSEPENPTDPDDSSDFDNPEDTSSIDRISNEKVSVSVEYGSIVIKAPNGENVEVYSLSGTRILSTKEYTIAGLLQGIYIIRVGVNTFKVAI